MSKLSVNQLSVFNRRKRTIVGIILLALTSFSLHAEEASKLKWHPGHYIFIAKNEITKEVLMLPHFRGIQKVYVWSDFEKEKGVYDFSSLKADLDMVRKYNRQMVIQFSYKRFFVKGLPIPAYVTGEEYGGGIYEGEYTIIWNKNVLARFQAMLAAFGKEFDSDPNLEAVNMPETALGAPRITKLLETNPPAGFERYTEKAYLNALKGQMLAMRQAFPHTAVIQFMNFPVGIIDEVTDYAKEIGVGMGGPDVYPRDGSRLSDPVTGVYRLYDKLAGFVPMGAAVQKENYSMAAKKQSGWGRANLGKVVPGDEIPFPVRDHLKMAQEKLKLNYLFWFMDQKNINQDVVKLLEEPDLVGDIAGGLITKIPPKTFMK